MIDIFGYDEIDEIDFSESLRKMNTNQWNSPPPPMKFVNPKLDFELDPDHFMEWLKMENQDVIGDLSDTEQTKSQYNVGYNTFGQYPLTTLEIVSQMVVRDVPKGRINNVKWDLSEYGYNCYVFYMDLIEGTSWETKTDYFGNWPGYGEWGFYNNDGFQKNTIYTVAFRYLDNGKTYNLNFSY